METGDGGSQQRERAMDRISALPDDVLHIILLRLDTVSAVARTSALSRRWRRVWAHLPELRLRTFGRLIYPASCASHVDGALAGYAAPTLHRLVISVTNINLDSCITGAHVAPWLRFAAERVAGELSLSLLGFRATCSPENIDLPVCSTATRIDLDLNECFMLRPPREAASTFAALTALTICDGRMGGRELGRLVSFQCPRLEELDLTWVTLEPVAGADVSISSGSLRRLQFRVRGTRRLEVAAPRLRAVYVSMAKEARVAAPNLEEVVHTDDMEDRCEYAAVGCRLRRLEATLRSPMAKVLRRFDAVAELSLEIRIRAGREAYESFIRETSDLPECEVLVIRSSSTINHGFTPTMMHILRRCSAVRKVAVSLAYIRYSCLPADCSCAWTEGRWADNITLHSLEEVEFNDFQGRDDQVEFVNLVLGWNVPVLKRVVFNIQSFFMSKSEKIIDQKIHRAAHQDNNVKFESQEVY